MSTKVTPSSKKGKEKKKEADPGVIWNMVEHDRR